MHFYLHAFTHFFVEKYSNGCLNSAFVIDFDGWWRVKLQNKFQDENDDKKEDISLYSSLII